MPGAAVPSPQPPKNKEALDRKFPSLVRVYAVLSTRGGNLQTNRRLPLSAKQRRKSEISGVEIFNISFFNFYPADHDKYLVGCISATEHRQAGI